VLTHRPIEQANRSIRAVGESLAKLKNELVLLFDEVDGSNGLDADEVKRLRSAGLRSGSTRIASEQPDEAEERLREHALNELARTRSLKEVVGDLRHVEEGATPQSARETRGLLEKAAPDAMIEQTRAHPPLRVPVSDWRSLTIVFVMFGAAATSWSWVWPATALLLCGLYLYFFVVTHPLSDVRGLSWRGLQRAARASSVYLIAGTVMFGLSAGLGLRGAINVVPVKVLGILLAVVALGALARYAWRAASRRWLDSADLVGAREAGRRMLEVTASVAINDWILAESRVRFARIAGKLAGSLEAMRVALLADLAPGTTSLPADAQGSTPEEAQPEEQGPTDLDRTIPLFACNPAVRADLSEVGGGALYKHSAMLEEIVLHDYLDAIASTITDHWPQIAMGDASTGERVVVSALKRRLHWYRRDLGVNGLFGTRASAGSRDENALSVEGRQRRRELLAELWESLDLESLLEFSADADLVQFCSAETLVLLDQDPVNARITRFAPASKASARATSDIVRTRSMLMAGVLRIVPLRTGTVLFEEDERGLSIAAGARNSAWETSSE
jgi:hypothetical protein